MNGCPASDPLREPQDGPESWTARLDTRWLVGAAVVSSIPLVVIAVTAVPVLWVPAVVSVGIVLLLADLRVIVDRRGLCLRAGLLRWSIKRIALADLGSVRVERIDAWDWGGLGYRVAPGRSALVLRSGPGLVVRRTDGRLFAVTVPDPQTPAALLDRLRGSDPHCP